MADGMCTEGEGGACACGQGHAAARPAFEAILAQAEGVLHPMHVTVIDALMPLVNCCRAAGARTTPPSTDLACCLEYRP